MSVKMYGDKSPQFEAACERAKIPPTRRQWKKWTNASGLAYKNHQDKIDEDYKAKCAEEAEKLNVTPEEVAGVSETT